MSAPLTAASVLVVEDDETTAELERRVLSRAGANVHVVSCVRDALQLLSERSFSAILIDYNLPDGQPWAVVDAAQRRVPRIPAIVATAGGTEKIATEALHHHVAEYVKKTETFWGSLPSIVERVVVAAREGERQRRSETLFQLIANHASDIVEISDHAGIITYVSSACTQVLGYRPEEMMGHRRIEFAHPDDDLGWLDESIPALSRRTRRRAGWQHKNGSCVWLDSASSVSRSVATDQKAEVIAIHRDVTAQKRAEEALQESEARFRTLFAETPISLWEEDFSEVRKFLDEQPFERSSELCAHLRARPDVVAAAVQRIKVIAVNQATLRLYEASSQEQLFSRLGETFGPTLMTTFCEELCAFISGKTHFEAETTTATLGGKPNTVSVRVNVIPGCERTWSRVVVSIFDLTAHKEVERRLRLSLRDKEVLLSEVHHRVKNNLQVVSSLLSLQASQVSDDQARQLFSDSQSRVKSIALAHEQLYQTANLSHIDLGDYAKALLRAIDHALNGTGRGISLRVEAEPLQLSADAAITCGLVINELVTNALKHGFPEGRRGSVLVDIKAHEQTAVQFSVRDDGKGLPESVDPWTAQSVGLSLVVGLARQLDATLKIERDGGTVFSLTFQKEDEATEVAHAAD